MPGSGPLVVRWRALELAPVEAGARQLATVEAENAGSAPWRTRGPHDGLFLAYQASNTDLDQLASLLGQLQEHSRAH